MTAFDSALQSLRRQQPEWEPWLVVVQEVLREATDRKWETFVPVRTKTQHSTVPLLAEVTLAFDMITVARWSERLMQAAYQTGTPKISTLRRARAANVDAATLFKASLCQNGERLKETAVNLGADPDALQAVAVLIPVPFLQACNRHWAASISESWMEGYCPVCGAWPAFAEVRGIERSRHFRCGRCGGDWQTHSLVCPYCAETDHNELVSLVPEKSGSNAVIEACKRCLGYVKVFTTLQGRPPANVILDDLASVDLDIAAFEQGYQRPPGAGFSLELTVTAKSPTRRLFAWQS